MEIEHFTYLYNLIYGAYILMHKQLFIKTGNKYEFTMNRLVKKIKWVPEVEHLQILNVMFK